MLNITDKSKEDKITPLLRLGFRPFFLFGSLYTVLSILVWVYSFQYGQPSALNVPALWWHVHEMLFGFAMAIVAGFVLTAVQTWTGINGTKGFRLGVIVSLWALPRLLFWTQTPLWLISIVEALFLAAVTYEVGFRVIKSKGWRNLFFVPLFVLALIANFASYATIKGLPPFPSLAVWQAMLWWFMLLLSVMGGRVIPFFTARKFNFEKAQPQLWLDVGANLPLVMLFVLSFFPLANQQLSQAFLLVGALFQFIRFARWKPWLTLSEPLVWSLHGAYLCIPLGLLASGLSEGFFKHSMIHLFAIGALSGVILAMISRVTMGHTGHAIYEGPRMWPAFLALFIAALIRSFAVALFPEHLMLLVNSAAVLWTIAFVMFLYNFAIMLMTPRVDGHPG
ncbi:NnrS family protein [Vibrio sp. DW001]|uniref:NnrS family protein n=1 Tax=Vibrio sp. DW001 TaxID=2912315 RepID=UPI0023B1D3CD|nr:NnrS family protein [Vibrio sp. DW001]WED27788.1 NnrS family protein [Vibrio sp. DW001]